MLPDEVRWSALAFLHRKFRLKLYFVFLLIEEMKFGEVIIRIGAYSDLLLVFPSPVPSSGAETEESSLGEISVHDRMHC